MSLVLDKVAENGLKTLNHCCLLCRSTDGIFSDIYLKKFAEVRALLKEILKVQLNQNEANSRMICHKCIFKLKVQKEFKDMPIGEITNSRMCIICGDVGHSDLKITYPDVKNKLELWSEENRAVKKKPNSMLCTMCFCKLELLDDLKIQASMNLARNEIESISEDNVPNVISKINKKLMSVKDMVQLGLVKVEGDVFKDTNMYVNLLKVNLVNIPENNKNVLTKRRSVMKEPNQNKKKNMNQWKVKLNSAPKKEQRKKSVRTSENRKNEVSEDIEEIVVKPPRSKKRSAIKSTKEPKGNAAFNPDENLNCITVHKDEINNPTNIMIPVIILNREEVNETTTIKSSRKRALQDVNEAKEEEGHEVKEKMAKILVVNGLGGEEAKSNEMKENILKIPNDTEATEQNSAEKINGNTHVEESTKVTQEISATNEVDNLESLSAPTSPSPVSSSPEEIKDTADNEETDEAKTVNNIEEDEEVILPKFVADDSESSDTVKLSQDVNDQKESEESSESEAAQVHETADEILNNDKDGASDTISDEEMKSDKEQGISSDVKEQKESNEESSDSEATQQVQELVNEIIVNDKDGTALETVHDEDIKSDEEMKSDKEGIKCDEEGIIKAGETINLIQDDSESEDELTLIAKHINSSQVEVPDTNDKNTEQDEECNEKIMNNESIEAATELMEVDQEVVVESTKDNDIPV